MKENKYCEVTMLRCIKKDPTKIIEMSSNIQWLINKYIDLEYISQAENKYTGDVDFNNSRQEILSELIKKNNNRKLSLDDIISMLRDEKGPDGENYNLSSIARGICNIDTQQMIIFDPKRAKVAFYQKNMQLTGEILSNINYEGLRSFKSKAQLLYLYSMYYNKINNKIEAQKYEKKFLLLVTNV